MITMELLKRAFVNCELHGVCLSYCLLAVVTRFGFCQVKIVFHFLWWMIHLVDVVTNVLFIQTMYQILRRKNVYVVLDL